MEYACRDGWLKDEEVGMMWMFGCLFTWKLVGNFLIGLVAKWQTRFHGHDSMIIFWVVDEEKSLNYGNTGMKLLYPLFHHHSSDVMYKQNRDVSTLGTTTNIQIKSKIVYIENHTYFHVVSFCFKDFEMCQWIWGSFSKVF